MMHQSVLKAYLGIVLLFAYPCIGRSFDLKCPEAVHWNLRAKSFCYQNNNIDNYYCLYNSIHGNYTEGCEGPDWDRSGQKRIITGYFTRGNCNLVRYQPFNFWTNGSSECVYFKSLCSGEGQSISKNGSGYYDRTCRCDFGRKFDFIHPPKDHNNCRPSVEDCTCYQKDCCDANDVEQTDSVRSNHEVKIRNDTSEILSHVSRLQDRRYAKYTVTIFVSLIIGIIIGITGKLLSEKLHTPSDRNKAYVDSERVFEKRQDDELKKEELNFLRIVHLLYGVACPVIRIVFDSKTKESGKTTLKYEIGTNKGNTSSSQVKIPHSYDIKTMMSILKTQKIFDIGDQLPRSTNKMGDMLTKILYYRNVIVDTVVGRLSDDEFKTYWKDIGKTTLTIVAKHLNQIGKQDTLKERLLQMSQPQVDERKLRQFVFFTERFPCRIMQRIINIYCDKTFPNKGISYFLKTEEHTLFHRRKKQDYCCTCQCRTFQNTISEESWNQLFVRNEIDVSCDCCRQPKTCSKRYKTNPKFQLRRTDVSLLALLIINSPQLLRFVVQRMFSRSFYNFLQKTKHAIFHAVKGFCEKECCECKYENYVRDTHKLTQDDWKRLFIWSKNDNNNCSIKKCCCQFSVKDKISIDGIDDHLMFKIMNVVGPFHTFDRDKENTLEQFLRWNGDCTTFFNANRELLAAVQDNNRVTEMELVQQDPFAHHFEEDFISKWILQNTKEKSTTEETTEAIILFDNKGKIATQKVFVSSSVYDRLWGARCFKYTDGEKRFLRLKFCLIQIVCPILRHEFERRLRNFGLRNLLTKLEDETTKGRPQTEINVEYGTEVKTHFCLTEAQRSRIFSTQRDKPVTSADLDLQLLILIFEKMQDQIKTQKENFFERLEKVKKVRQAINQNSSGTFNYNDFEKYWGFLSKVALSFEGPKIQNFLERCKYGLPVKEKI